MAGLGISINGLSAALSGLGGISARLTDQRPMWDEIGAYVETITVRRFERGMGPGDVAWKPSRRARATGGKTLVDSGRLRSSISRNVMAEGVEVGSNVEYAAIHQFGGTITAKTPRGLRFRYATAGGNRDSWATKQSVTIPARPFLGIDDEDGAEIARIAEDHVRGADAD